MLSYHVGLKVHSQMRINRRDAKGAVKSIVFCVQLESIRNLGENGIVGGVH
jgi:hypothetical protein